MADKQSGFVADIQHYSIQDGPGIRTTVFVKGCPLRCSWCHNPEMLNPKAEVWYNERVCKHCGKCIAACPVGALKGIEQRIAVDRELCQAGSGCRKCVEVCSTGALDIVGNIMSVEDALKEVREDAVFYRRSGGGACISGGEPLMQADFAAEFLKGCQESLIDTTMETCAYARWDLLSKVARYADLMLIDIKHMDPLKHEEGTGVSNKMILENVARLSKLGKKIRIRMPVIPGYNDSEENLRKTAEFMVAYNLKYIDLLPFHSTGGYKYDQLGREYKYCTAREPSPEEMAGHMALFESYGIGGTIGGTDIEPF